MTSRKRRYIRLGVIACVLAAAAAFGSTKLLAGSPGSNDTSYTDALGHRISVPANLTPAQVISTIANRSGSSTIRSAGLGSAPNVPGARPGIYLHFVVDADAADQTAIRAEWGADLVEGAVADAFAFGGQGRVVGSTIDLSLPNGSVLPDVTGGMGDITPGQDFSSASDEQIKSTLAAALNNDGLTPVSIDILHADQPAPAVVAETNDPEGAAAKVDQTLHDLFGMNPPIYEGFYFELRDSGGTPLVIASAAYRAGAGRSWTNPQVADVAPQVHG
jgi:hypothetical protein